MLAKHLIERPVAANGGRLLANSRRTRQRLQAVGEEDNYDLSNSSKLEHGGKRTRIRNLVSDFRGGDPARAVSHILHRSRPRPCLEAAGRLLPETSRSQCATITANMG
jgi:hypothetical protein